MKRKFFIVCLGLNALFIFSCKKSDTLPNDNGGGFPDAEQLIKKDVGDGGTTTYSYNNKGQCTQKLYSDGSKALIEYLPGTVNQKVYNSAGVNTQTYSYELNGEGVRVKETRSNDPAYYALYTLNSDNQVLQSFTHINNSNVVINNFISNGNIDSTRFTDNGNYTLTIKKTYYMDKTNGFDYSHYGTTFFGKNSKNLLKTEQYFYSDGTVLPVTSYTYEFDAKGRITKLVETQNNNINITYYNY